MDKDKIAELVIDAVGGAGNIKANGVCMTRLRLTTRDPSKVDDASLLAIPGVLGVRHRGGAGVEVVFGPRIVEDVWRAFVARTGIPPKDGRTFFAGVGGRAAQPVVHSPSTASGGRPKAVEAPSAPERPGGDSSAKDVTEAARTKGGVVKVDSQEDIAALVQLLDGSAPDAGETPRPHAKAALLVINGPNINMLGVREPSIYGTHDYHYLEPLCQKAAREAGFATCEVFQSNHEGDIVDKIQEALGAFDGIVINPAAYTHTSVAILDALKAVALPAVEVHISQVDQREGFRRISFVRLACFETVAGLGLEGYAKAIRDLAAHIGLG